MELTQDLAAQLQALLASQGAVPTTAITVGLSRGLFESAVNNNTLKNLKFDFQSSSNMRLAVADGTLDVEKTEVVLGKFQEAAKTAEGVLHVRSSLSMDIAEEIMDAFDEAEEATYLNLTFIVTNDVITGKKVTTNEGVVMPSIKFSGIAKLHSYSVGTNPMAERGVLATEDELLELIKEDAARSRSGFNGWAASQSNNGEKEQLQTDVSQAALDALLPTTC